MTSRVVLDFDTTALAALRKGPKEFAVEVKAAAELFKRKVPACQVAPEDLLYGVLQARWGAR